MERSVNDAQVEIKKLQKELEMREMQTKCLLQNEANGFGWRDVADEKSEIVKEQKRDIENMKRKIDAGKHLEINHRDLRRDYDTLERHFKELEQDYGNLRYEKTKFDKKRHDLETRLDRRTQECLKAKHALEHVSHLLMQKPSTNAQSWVYSFTGLTRTLKDVLDFASNGHDLPPVVYSYLQDQFTTTMTSLCMVNDIQFNTAVIDYASGNTCVQQKVCGLAATVPRHRAGACESCVMLQRICLQKEDYYLIVVVPLPKHLRRGKKVEELGYWVQGW